MSIKYKPYKYNIGEQVVACENSRVTLVEITGTRKNAHIRLIRFLSDVIENAETLRNLVQETAKQRGLTWNTAFYDGKYVFPKRINKPLKTPCDAAVLGGDAKLKPGSVVLGGLKALPPTQTETIGESPLPSSKPKSFPTCSPREDLKKAINKINGRFANHQARFREFVELKSGWDEFSRLREDALLDKIPPPIQDFVALQLDPNELADSSIRDKIYRWWLRGLTIEAAIRKCRVDQEVSTCAAISHY
jgi:ribonuclease HI